MCEWNGAPKKSCRLTPAEAADAAGMALAAAIAAATRPLVNVFLNIELLRLKKPPLRDNIRAAGFVRRSCRFKVKAVGEFRIKCLFAHLPGCG